MAIAIYGLLPLALSDIPSSLDIKYSDSSIRSLNVVNTLSSHSLTKEVKSNL